MAKHTFPMPNLLRSGLEERLRLESVVNMLLQLGVKRENLVVVAEGGFRRFRGEIIRQSPDPEAEVGPDTRVTLWVTQEGIADNMPESIFSLYGFLDRKEGEPERPARDFFIPLDNVLFHASSLLEYVVGVHDALFPDQWFTRYFLRSFGFPDRGWDERELSIWQTILPCASGWVGTKSGIEAVLSMFSGVDARIVENLNHSTEIPEVIQTRLGERGSRLGADFLLGDSFQDTDSAFEVVLGPIPVARLPNFVPGGKDREKLDRILSLSTPGDLDSEIELTLGEEERRFVPGREPGNNLLGYSTWI